jgi:hypothetical protein
VEVAVVDELDVEVVEAVDVEVVVVDVDPLAITMTVPFMKVWRLQ